MPKLNANVYGADETAMANAVSSDALDVAVPGVNIENYWENTVANDLRHTSRSSSDSSLHQDDQGKAPAKAFHFPVADKRACTEGNHGKQGCNK